jgi:ribosomal protein S18 acetylase RimI-like enzyme
LIENTNAYNNSSSIISNNNSLKLNNFTSLAKNFVIDQDFDAKNEIELRNLCSDDIPELKVLCAEWFPVDYPDSWYIDITSTKRFYSLAAIYKLRIVGMIVAEIKTKKSTDKEDWHILSNKHSSDTQITYILSLGVYKELRRHGIGELPYYNNYYY